jgi:hypothetical protein
MWEICALTCGLMRNSTILLITVICFFTCSSICSGQMLDNRLNISAGYHLGTFHGNGHIQNGSFLYPAFYSNLANMNGIWLKALYKAGAYVSPGIKLAGSNASGWKYDDNPEYNTASVRLFSIAPVLQFHTKHFHKGFFNRGKLFAEISSAMGISGFTSSDELFQIQGVKAVSAPKESNDFFYGIEGSAGLEWSLSQTTGIMMSYSLHHNRVSSILYSEKYFTASQLNIGIVFRLMKDKHFLYRD